MTILVKYISYPNQVGEVRMELDSRNIYQTIEIVEAPNIGDDNTEKYEILFKVVDNSSQSVTKHAMSKQELADYIAILKQVLVQAK